MAKYEKWLGAGLGFVVGGPIGSLIGFLAGNMMERGSSDTPGDGIVTGISEFEVNLIILSSHLIKIDGQISMQEITFLQNFLDTHFDAKYSAERTNVIHHCLQKEYDLGISCTQLRVKAQHHTRVQVVRLLLDLAMCDGELNERENYYIFRIAGYLNINDVEFRRIKAEFTERTVSVYDLLEISSTATTGEIRTAYRRLVLKYHPDRNKNAGEQEKKQLASKFQQIQEAYEYIKKERGIN